MRGPATSRELQSVIKQALLQTTAPVLLPDFLPASVRRRGDGTAATPEVADWERFVAEQIAAGSEDLYAEALAIMERQVLTAVLRHTGGNQVQAARLLGIARKQPALQDQNAPHPDRAHGQQRRGGGGMSDVTRLLAAIDQGDPHAAGQLLPLVYDELRKLAAQRMAQEAPGQTLQATAPGP